MCYWFFIKDTIVHIKSKDNILKNMEHLREDSRKYKSNQLT